jgi:hypothetical protein
VAVHGSERGGEKDRADDHENYGIGIAEVKVTAAHLLEKEENADGDDDGRADKGANGASGATASWVVVAHLCSSLLAPLAKLAAGLKPVLLADFYVG